MRRTLATGTSDNIAFGRVTRKDDFGINDGMENLKSAYDQDEQTRDRLISHMCDYVASACAPALSAFKAEHEAKEIAKSNRYLQIAKGGHRFILSR